MTVSSHADDTGHPVSRAEERPARSFAGWLLPTRIAVALIILATLAAYSNSLRGPFIFDDLNDIAGNAAIRHLRPLRDIFLDTSHGRTDLHSRPVVRLSLAVNYAMGGMETLPYHLTNLAVHLLAALLLFGIVRRTLLLPRLEERFRRVATPLALGTALLWSLHPLQTAAVTYVIQRYESMMGLFSLLALYCVVRSATSTRPRAWAAGAVSATLLALGCKEVAVVVPLCILLYDRAFLAGSFREAWGRRRPLYLGFLVSLAMFAALQLLAGPRGRIAGFSLPLPWYAYARTQPGVILHYLRLSFWPRPLVLDYGWPVAQTAGEILPGAALVGGLAAATAHALVRRPQWGFLGAWFFLILAPTSSIMPIADLAFLHRMYLPLAAVAVAVVLGGFAGGAAILRSRRLPTAVVATIGGGALVAVGCSLAVATWRRNADFASAVSIWTDTVAKAPRNARAWFGLGQALASQGETDAAIANYRKALEINPHYADAYNNLGMTLMDRGQTGEAVPYLQRTLSINPGNAEAHVNLGLALAEGGQIEEALGHLRQALEINPGHTGAHNNIAMILAGRGRDGEAIDHLQEALRIDPAYAKAHYNLGVVLAGQGRADEAIEHLQRAVAIKPAYARAHCFLGRTLTERGRTDAAIAHYRRALEIDPGYAEARAGLERALQAARRQEP